MMNNEKQEEEKPKDPVCGMEVDPKRAATFVYKDKTYYFCSPTCQWAFETNPNQFTDQT